MMRLVILGPPGAGKGTQAQVLARRFGVPAVSTGDLFRAIADDDTELGSTARSYMASGRLVPDAVTNAIVTQRLEQGDAADGFVLDGFPRTVEQARELDGILASSGLHLDVVLALRADEQEIVRRLSGRRTCRVCATAWHVEFRPPQRAGTCDSCGGELYQRGDDNDATIRERLLTYQLHTAPLISFYRGGGRLVAVDAVGSMDDVAGLILEALIDSLDRSNTAAATARADTADRADGELVAAVAADAADLYAGRRVANDALRYDVFEIVAGRYV